MALGFAPMKLLLVEDNPTIQTTLRRAFERRGMQVIGCEDGARALDRWEASMPDVVLLDLSLPGLDGLEVLSRARAAGLRTPVMILTARGTVGDRILGLNTGADDYLAKPFDFEELLARLEALARRGRDWTPATPSRLVVADLVFDRERMQASRAGQPLALTARELALLELMMSAPGRLFSRERILSNVWGASEDPLTNVVDVYIRRLRAKIDEGHARPLIHTVRGLGYRLEAPA